MADVKLPILPPSALRSTASAPSLPGRTASLDGLEALLDGEALQARGADPREPRPVPPQAALWLPALRPLTGCAGGGKVNAWEGSLATTARSFGVQSRCFTEISLPPTSRTASSKATMVDYSVKKSNSMPTLRSTGAQKRLADGVSRPATVQNERAQSSLRTLVNGQRTSTRTHKKLSKKESFYSLGSSVGFSMDEQGFLQAAGDMDKKLTQLKSGMDAFDPRQVAVKQGLSSTSNSIQDKSKGGEEEEDHDHRAEKFEAYKMCRRLEPEPPPLCRNLEQDLPPKTPPDQAIVLRNAKPDALSCWLPHERKGRLDIQKRSRDIRLQEAASRGQQQLEASTQLYAKILAQKRQQAEAAKEAKRKDGHGTSKPAKTSTFAEQWLSSLAAAAFAHRLKLATEKTKKRQQRGQCLREAVTMTFPGDDQKLLARLKFFAATIKMRHQINECREHAKVCWQALKEWNPSAKIYTHFKAMALKIARIQTWWRARSRVIRAAREHISQRFQAIERQELTKEHSRRLFEGLSANSNRSSKQGARSSPPPRRAIKPTAMLPLEDFIQLERLSDEVRYRFLDNELRARRYLLLPRIAIWEEDVRRWREDVKMEVDDRVAKKVVQACTEPQLFKFPPMRPSYLPPAHPDHQAFKAGCVEGCCGRRGDEQILDMVKRARAARDRSGGSGGWIEIPTKEADQGSKPKGRSGSKHGSGTARSRGSCGSAVAQSSTAPAEQPSPFGDDVTEVEMKAFGMDGADMPCLSDATGGPPAQETL